jgi:hypothetical protein
MERTPRADRTSDLLRWHRANAIRRRVAIAVGACLLAAASIWWYSKPIALDPEVTVECRALYSRAHSLDDTLQVDAYVPMPNRRRELARARVSCGALRARGRLDPSS